MNAHPLPKTDDTIYMVAQWKEDIDRESPWWQKLWYWLAFTPFMEFSLKVMKIPRPTEVTIKGDEVRFSWFEPEGFFATSDEADIGCLDVRWSYKDYPFGRLMPPESGQYGNGPIFPRAKDPRKRIKPIMSMVISPRKDQTALEHKVADLMKVLDA